MGFIVIGGIKILVPGCRLSAFSEKYSEIRAEGKILQYLTPMYSANIFSISSRSF
jgi:hypothetical protein